MFLVKFLLYRSLIPLFSQYFQLPYHSHNFQAAALSSLDESREALLAVLEESQRQLGYSGEKEENGEEQSPYKSYQQSSNGPDGPEESPSDGMQLFVFLI